MMVGLRDRLDILSDVAAKPRSDPLVAQEVLLDEYLAVLSVAAKHLDELGGVVEMEISISMSNRDDYVDYSTVEKVPLSEAEG